ncbi:MAG: alpha-1,6-glucosidase domain-containing protein [Arenimonas sp.]
MQEGWPDRQQTRDGAWRGLRLGLFAWALATASGAVPAATDLRAATELPIASRSDCDAADFATVLKPAPRASAAAPESRAIWLDAHSLAWPGSDGRGAFKLYYSASGQMQMTRAAVAGADGFLSLTKDSRALPPALAERFKYLAAGPVLTLAPADRARLPALLRGQLLLVREDAAGKTQLATGVQHAGALDALYLSAAQLPELGVSLTSGHSQFRLWAPTAQSVAVCRYRSGTDKSIALETMLRDAGTGAWTTDRSADLSGSYYLYLVDVFVPGIGIVRNRVTDPYSISLSTDSQRSYIADLDAAALKPDGWDGRSVTTRLVGATDLVIYELHVRDFSASDASVLSAHRGRYLAFTDSGSQGMKHLLALSAAGLTDVHLLPVFDFATVPEASCVTPAISDSPDAATQQAAVVASAAADCFNWGYDPYHFSAPEGSYASDAADGAVRIREFRQMVQALHRAGLRVGMDVVYNHTTASGQKQRSVLDRTVPGYYQRLDARGAVEHSTCCDNTATENMMMAKLMIDSVQRWARAYKIDSFRFDLMGHQPRAVMEQLHATVNEASGREVQLIGEGWNFGEVANGARFVQASQLSLPGSGIGTFSDRGRDALRGGGAGDSGEAMFSRQGYINGLVYAANAHAPKRPLSDLLQAADMVRVGLAGSLRDYPMVTWDDQRKTLQQIAYGDQPAGYASAPAEVVNYVENHDNQSLFDNNVYKLPLSTNSAERARVQMLGTAIVAFSQGIAYFHAGVDTLRSKSLDRNSYDSGDWFNRLDWSYRDNYFASGLPPAPDNGKDFPLMRPLLANRQIKPTARDIAFARDAFRDQLRIRASSTLFRLNSGAEIKQRLKFYNTGSKQNPVLIAGHLDGTNLDGARFKEVLYLVNVDTKTQSLLISEEKNKAYTLHPVHLAPGAADQRPTSVARYQPATGRFTIPARTALVYVVL